VPYQNLTLAIPLVSGTASESRLLTIGFHMQMTPSPKTLAISESNYYEEFEKNKLQ